MVERSFDLKFETFSNKIARPPVLSAWHKRCRHPFCSSSPIFCIDCTKRGRTLSPKTAGVTDETSSSRRPSDPPNAVSKFSTGFIYLFSGWQLPIFFRLGLPAADLEKNGGRHRDRCDASIGAQSRSVLIDTSSEGHLATFFVEK